MAQYTINFSSNASDVIKELDRVVSSVAKVEKAGSKVVLDLDASRLTRSIDTTFKALDKHINEMQRKLSRLQIGSGAFRSTQAAIGFREGQRERGESIGQSLRLRGQAQSFEQGSLIRLGKELQALQIEASQIKPNSQEWASFQQQIGRIQGELKKADQAAEAIQLRENLGAFTPGSLDRLSARLRLLKIEANAISPSTDKWKQVNNEIKKTEESIQKINKKPLSAGQRAGAAGGAFLYGGGLGGGAGSALGGIAGGLAGGVPGAFAGAAVGQLTDNLIAQAAAVAKISAEYNKSRIALAGVTSSQADFNKALDAASSIGQKFLLPITDATQQFTKLQASVRGAGYDTETTVKAFNGISSAIIATGGSTEDLNGALLAVSQVFSKGKVSAEELRQQIGERLAGAFTIFADSSGIAAKELDKLLSKGEVTLDDFVKFLDELGKRYGTTADLLASAPENAGPRLAVAIQSMQLAYGGFFQRVGAGFQAYATDLINFAIANQKGFQQVVATVAVAAQDIYNIFSGLIDTLIPPLTSFFKFIFENFARGINALSSLADESRRAAGGPEKRAQAAVDKAFAGRPLEGYGPFGGERFTMYKEALDVELAEDTKGKGAQKTQQKRIDEMMKNLFAPFQPSKFGSALSTGGPKGGGPGAIDKEKKKKAESLESFERLRDQLANTYNQAEIDRIKARYELEKQLQDNLRDVQELGANRLERLNLQFIRNLQNAERKRVDAMMDAQLDLMQVQGKVSGGADIGVTGGGGFSTAQLQKASSEAAKFTGIANMCSESVKAFYKSLGISLPGVTAWADTVRKAGKTMTDWSKLQAGDIVATGRPGDTPHVGVYTGGNNVFHQSRKRGLKAGNYPDLDYFKSGYFVRPSAMDAGAPRKVGSNENRDMLAAANAEIKRGNILLAEKNGLLLKDSEIMKVVASYVDEAFGVPNLELDNKLLAERNRLTAEGVDENTINYRLKLIEMESRHTHLTKLFDEELKKANLTEEQRAAILDVLTQGLNRATAAEKTKNDETLRGLFIQEQTALSRRMTMAQALTPDQELRAQIGERFSGAEAEQLFQQTKAVQAMEKQKEQFQSIASSIGDSFGTAFKSIVTGSMTAQQALATMFQSIADNFLDMAAQMIAAWIKMAILNTVIKIFGGTLTTAASPEVGAIGQGSSIFAAAEGAYWPGGFQAFADGGLVTKPTMGLIGEGGESEYVIPASKMQSAMARYSRGARGESVIAGSGGGSEGGTATAAAGPMVVDVRYNVERINEVEYVTASQFQAGMRQAAQQGASQGEQRTLRRLQQSPGTRKRVGM